MLPEPDRSYPKAIRPFERGAKGVDLTVTTAAVVLLAGTGSEVAEPTVTLLLITLSTATELLTVAIRTPVAVAPTAKDGKLIVRLFPEPPQVPSVAPQEKKVTSDGRLSVTVTELAGVPALFVTVTK